MLNFLSGKKTYILAIAAGAVTTLTMLGYISTDMAMQINMLIGAGGLATLRDGIGKIGN